MHHNFLFDLDQTLLDFHASEYKALGIVLRANGLPFHEGEPKDQEDYKTNRSNALPQPYSPNTPIILSSSISAGLENT